MHCPTREGRGGKRVAGWGAPSSSALRPTGDCGAIVPAVSRSVCGDAFSRISVNTAALRLVQSLDNSLSQAENELPAEGVTDCPIRVEVV
jgi:hypothetical protein